MKKEQVTSNKNKTKDSSSKIKGSEPIICIELTEENQSNNLPDNAILVSEVQKGNEVMDVYPQQIQNSNDNDSSTLPSEINNTAGKKSTEIPNEKKRKRKGGATLLTDKQYKENLLASQQNKKQKITTLASKLTKAELETQLLQAQFVNSQLMNQMRVNKTPTNIDTNTIFNLLSPMPTHGLHHCMPTQIKNPVVPGFNFVPATNSVVRYTQPAIFQQSGLNYQPINISNNSNTHATMFPISLASQTNSGITNQNYSRRMS